MVVARGERGSGKQKQRLMFVHDNNVRVLYLKRIRRRILRKA